MIASVAIEVSVLTGAACLLAAGTWALTGGPERDVACDPAQLKPGYICFEDAIALPNLLWVDARTRDLWKSNGYPGSILLTDHHSEDFELLMAEAFESLAAAENVVVYCATEGCGSSEPVSRKVAELGLMPAEQIFVLAGGWKALQDEDDS